MTSSTSSSKDYAALTATIENNLDDSSPLLSHRQAIKDTLEWFLDLPHSHVQLSYSALILSIKTHQLAMAKNITIDGDGLQMKTDSVVKGRTCRTGLKYNKQADGSVDQYVVVMGAESENNAEAMEKFVEEVERIGQEMVAALEATLKHANREETSF